MIFSQYTSNRKKREVCQSKYRAFHNVLRDSVYNKKTKGPTLLEFFTATGKLKKFFFF